MNIHLHYNDTLYFDDFDVVKRRLIELRVRHVRDGLIDTSWQGYYDRHNALGRAGIKGVFIAGPEASEQLLEDYPRRMAASFEAYEGPNEYDLSGRRDWVGSVRTVMQRLHAVQQRHKLQRFLIFGPSVTSEAAYATLGDVSAWSDRANMHNYLAGRHPGTDGWGANGYGSIAWNLEQVKKDSGGKPVVATETGYWTAPTQPDAVPELVASAYLPRLLLEHFRVGINRTYLYELSDQGAQRYGLLARDGTPKPAFRAVEHLLRLLSDPGPEIAVRPLRYSLSGGGGEIRHMAFEKRDGSYYLALWLERPLFDVATRRELDTVRRPVRVTLAGRERLVRSHAWQSDGRVDVTPPAFKGIAGSVVVSDRLLVLELRRGRGSP